jgi:hypothetical protein
LPTFTTINVQRAIAPVPINNVKSENCGFIVSRCKTPSAIKGRRRALSYRTQIKYNLNHTVLPHLRFVSGVLLACRHRYLLVVPRSLPICSKPSKTAFLPR